MAAGEIIAWAQRWRGGIPGAVEKALSGGMVELVEPPPEARR